jgi:hypothetical protein
MLFAAHPSKRLVIDDNHCNSVAARKSTTYRAVAHKHTREFGGDLESDGSAVAFSLRHCSSTCVSCYGASPHVESGTMIIHMEADVTPGLPLRNRYRAFVRSFVRSSAMMLDAILRSRLNELERSVLCGPNARFSGVAKRRALCSSLAQCVPFRHVRCNRLLDCRATTSPKLPVSAGNDFTPASQPQAKGDDPPKPAP